MSTKRNSQTANIKELSNQNQKLWDIASKLHQDLNYLANQQSAMLQVIQKMPNYKKILATLEAEQKAAAETAEASIQEESTSDATANDAIDYGDE